MANAKISALTSATTPLAGTEVLPIVQSGSTVKVSVANLTVGRAVATAGGSFTDNITQSTAAKGINFTANTPAAGMDNQLLNWYETGTFSPTVLGSTGGTATYSEQTGYYTRVGNLVFIKIRVTCASVSSMTGQARIGALPFTCSGSSGRNSVQTGAPAGLTGSTTITSVSGSFVVGNTTQIALADASGVIIDATNYTNTFSIDITGVYQV